MKKHRGRRQSVEGPDSPTVAYVSYQGPGGEGRVNCAIVEDPELDDEGYRVFWLEPLEPVPKGQDQYAVYLDVLPPKSVAMLRAPNSGFFHPPQT